MDVYWLEQTEADVPRENDWLSAAEATVLEGMRFEKRRGDWRLGRWTAKRALSSFWNSPSSAVALSEIEIIAAPTGAPEVYVTNTPAAVSISLSHRAGRAMCAVSLSGVALGCDLEIIEPRTDAFVADYFVQEEQELVARAPERFQLVALLWSGKESALKALREGLRLDTRSVVVTPMNGALAVDGWSPLEVRCPEGQVFGGWWQRANNVVRTLVADTPHPPPILLDVAASFPQSPSRDLKV